MSSVRLTGLADHLRRAGLEVIEVKGWKGRGAPDRYGRPQFFSAMPDTILAHHTATSDRAAGDMPSLRLLIDGRRDLSGPLSQLGLSRTGVVYVIAAGKANHAGRGAWRGQTSSSRTIGVEAENDGSGKPWPVKQLDAYERLCAALCDYLNVDAERVCAHREWALPTGRKPDPAGIEMNAFRDRVRSHLASAPPVQQEDEMYAVVSDPSGQTGDFGTNGVSKFAFESQEAKNDWAAAFGAKRIVLSLPAFDAIPTVERAQ